MVAAGGGRRVKGLKVSGVSGGRRQWPGGVIRTHWPFQKGMGGRHGGRANSANPLESGIYRAPPHQPPLGPLGVGVPPRVLRICHRDPDEPYSRTELSG